MGVEKWIPANTPLPHLCCGLRIHRHGPSKTTLGNDCGHMYYMYQGTFDSLQMSLLIPFISAYHGLISTTTVSWEPTMCKAGAKHFLCTYL